MTLQVDASEVYARGMRGGLRSAVNLVARAGLKVPASLRSELARWEATVLHTEWMAAHGSPVPLPDIDEVTPADLVHGSSSVSQLPFPFVPGDSHVD